MATKQFVTFPQLAFKLRCKHEVLSGLLKEYGVQPVGAFNNGTPLYDFERLPEMLKHRLAEDKTGGLKMKTPVMQRLAVIEEKLDLLIEQLRNMTR